MPFVRLARLSELPADEGYRVELDDEQAVVLVRTGEGVYALEDCCSHEEYPLSEGYVEDGTIECALHGSRFDLASGEALNLPATRPVPTYPARVEGDDVLVDLPEDLAELAREALGEPA